MKTRILYVIDGIEFGGGERVFAQIINGLPEDRYETFLATAPNDAFQKAITVKNCSFFPIDFSNRYNAANLLKLIRIIKYHRIDIVHGQGARAEFYARLAAGLTGRKKYVATVAMPVEGYDVGPWKRRLYGIFDRFSERFVDRFLVVSDILVKSMIQVHGIAPGKVVKIYNGIETDLYRQENQLDNRRRIRQEFQVSDTDVLIGAIGRLVWQKGFEYFIQAVPELAQALPTSRYALIGDGILRRDLEKLANDLKIRDHILFTGQRTDIRDTLTALDIVVIPSVLEGFPIVTLEAMAMGKPIVATAIDGITEQIMDGREGILVPPRNTANLAQAIIKIVSNPIMADTLGKAARRRVTTEFSVQQMIKATINVYDDLL
ncbi:MAG: glycosyltransferase [Deltaproteobacteria bacterium]|nr:glycosyltransferase [Deltaproteobacteria bacterium]